MTGDELSQALLCYRFRYDNEKMLQGGVAGALDDLKVAYTPEYALNETDRIDFFVAGDGIGIEVKTNDSKGGAGLSAVLRQLWRYAKSDQVKSLVIVTTRSKHRDLPSEILGKPLHVIHLHGFV